jgi:acetate kinase
VCANLDTLGVVLDQDKNNATGATEATISAPDSRVKVMVIPTNEELVVAREAKRFLENHSGSPAPPSVTTREQADPVRTRSQI